MNHAASTEDVLSLVDSSAPKPWRILRIALACLCALALLARFDARSTDGIARQDRRPVSQTARAAVIQTPAHREAEEHLLEYVARRSSAYGSIDFEAAVNVSSAVTAILLHRDRPRSVALVLRSLVQYSFIREVVIWNNGAANLEHAAFAPMLGLSQIRLRIVNSPADLGNAARYHACTIARHDTCWFASDRWLNPYLDSMYAVYREQASTDARIVAAAPAEAAWHALRWRFFDLNIGVHTGFAPIETGAFASRDTARRFLVQQTVGPTALSRLSMLSSDPYFALWSNMQPVILSGDVMPVNLEGEPVELDMLDPTLQGQALDAIRRLHDILSLSGRQVTEFFSADGLSQQDDLLRAPCANDRCLFFTSLTPLDEAITGAPPSRARTGDKAQNRARPLAKAVAAGRRAIASADSPIANFDSRTLRSLADYTPQAEFPPLSWWRRTGSPHYAVDNSLPGIARALRPATVPGAALQGAERPAMGSCWSSRRPARAGDFIGLRLIPPRPTLRELVLVGSGDLAHIVAGDDDDVEGESWEVWTLADGQQDWEHRTPLRSAVAAPLPGASGFLRIVVQLQPSVQSGLASLKLVSRDGKREPVSVCGFELDGWTI